VLVRVKVGVEVCVGFFVFFRGGVFVGADVTVRVAVLVGVLVAVDVAVRVGVRVAVPVAGGEVAVAVAV
jgi:hypothetical protein